MRKLLLASLIGSLSLAGCKSATIKDANLVRQSATEQAQQSEQSPAAVIDQTKARILEGVELELAFYSPTYLSEAQKELAAAESSLTAPQQDPAATIAMALTAQQWIKRGIENKAQVEVTLKPSLDALAELESINTPTLLADDFEDIKDDVSDIIVLLEEGKQQKALQEQADLQEDFAALEVETLNSAFLKPVELELEAAEDRDADDYAEITLAEAESQAEALELFIKNTPKNREKIAQLSETAIRAAQHAKQVSLAVQPILRMGPAKAEQHVLSVEAYLARIGTALKHEDVRHLSLDSQSIAIAQKAETTNRRAQAFERQQQWEQDKVILSDQVKTLQTDLAAAQSQLESLQEAEPAQTEASDSDKPTTELAGENGTTNTELDAALTAQEAAQASAQAAVDDAAQPSTESPANSEQDLANAAESDPSLANSELEPNPAQETSIDAQTATNEVASAEQSESTLVTGEKEASPTKAVEATPKAVEAKTEELASTETAEATKPEETIPEETKPAPPIESPAIETSSSANTELTAQNP